MEAPEGTEAVPVNPPVNVTVASTVGVPRESIISLAFIDCIYGVYRN